MELRLGFLASHNGSNMQAIIDACKNKTLKSKPCVVISNNSKSGAIERAKKENIPYYHLSSSTHSSEEELDKAIRDALKSQNVNLVILAGYMKRLGPHTLKEFNNRVLNIHPALLPKYGGEGMYGILVHEAVIKAKEKKSGVTIHIVNSEYDRGPVINQVEVPVYENDSAETLAQRVLTVEHQTYVETIKKIEEEKIKL
ncbi:MAG: phosphoribosylglycinamide formyltransferase [Spirochaetes bacterium]|nr:phosphoribosylglycinamide formyltransferase [Spirochaetota bacterium]